MEIGRFVFGHFVFGHFEIIFIFQILSKPGPYPQIVVVTKGEECGFWLDGAIELEDIENSDSFIYTNVANCESKLETDDEGALSYRRLLEREREKMFILSTQPIYSQAQNCQF